jgi:hypothetical protein
MKLKGNDRRNTGTKEIRSVDKNRKKTSRPEEHGVLHNGWNLYAMGEKRLVDFFISNGLHIIKTIDLLSF